MLNSLTRIYRMPAAGSALRRWYHQSRLAQLLLGPIVISRNFVRRDRVSQFARFHRSFLELVQEGAVVVRLKDCPVQLEVDVRSDIFKRLLKHGNYEPELIRLLHQHVPRNRDAIDVGANIGLFSVFFSKLVSPSRRVLAIEPVPWVADRLRRNMARNGCDHSVILFRGVAANSDADCRLHYIQGKEEYSSTAEIVHPSVRGCATDCLTVQGARIDALVKQFQLEPGFVKIDVEGAEYEVLQGATVTIRRLQPILLMELNERLLQERDSSSQDVIKLLRDFNYHVVNANSLRLSVMPPFTGEILAIPRPSGRRHAASSADT